MIDYRSVKLGKLPYRHDTRNLQFAKYLPQSLRSMAQLGPPSCPSSCDWLSKVSKFGPMGNLDVGDCTVAGAGHMIQVWTANEGKEVILPDQDILAVYSKLSGYIPGNESTDNGLELYQVLKEWQQNGIDGHKIGAYVQVKNLSHMALACYLFGGLYCGVMLPLSAQDQDQWVVADQSLQGNAAYGSWGGHCVSGSRFVPLSFTFISWGKLIVATHTFIQDYFDEVWAIISQDFLDGKQENPLGINIDLLNQDLQTVKEQPGGP